MPFIDSTPESREAGQRPDLLAADQLHPSALAYQQWAEKIKQYIIQQLTAP
jgi:acyl-CoA thioesterase-1